MTKYSNLYLDLNTNLNILMRNILMRNEYSNLYLDLNTNLNILSQTHITPDYTIFIYETHINQN